MFMCSQYSIGNSDLHSRMKTSVMVCGNVITLMVLLPPGAVQHCDSISPEYVEAWLKAPCPPRSLHFTGKAKSGVQR